VNHRAVIRTVRAVKNHYKKGSNKLRKLRSMPDPDKVVRHISGGSSKLGKSSWARSG
jgi:hypothetical protein